MNDLLERLMESTMQEELRLHTQAKWHKKTEERIDYRNGYRYRDYLTEYGKVKGIKVPRLRKGRFKARTFRSYQARSQAVDEALKDVFLCGVSTRRVSKALSVLLDAPVSATTVSNVTKVLDKEVKKLHKRKLLDQYQYLILDGIVLKIKGSLEAEKKVILVVPTRLPYSEKGKSLICVLSG